MSSNTILRKGVVRASVSRIAKRRLDILHYAFDLKDLGAIPGKRFEALKGNIKNYYSIRINEN
jgi:toxin HigB-1